MMAVRATSIFFSVSNIWMEMNILWECSTVFRSMIFCPIQFPKKTRYMFQASWIRYQQWLQSNRKKTHTQWTELHSTQFCEAFRTERHQWDHGTAPTPLLLFPFIFFYLLHTFITRKTPSTSSLFYVQCTRRLHRTYKRTIEAQRPNSTKAHVTRLTKTQINYL